uniref:Erythrocyte membrane protein band 4.1 like 3 n=1 Tax=Tetraodon nigroviridis TaxID=99883 RepID=H3DBL8_TETNG
MTTESGTDTEAKQPQESKETEKGEAKAAEAASPQNQPVQLPAAAGHSTPARKQQVGASWRSQPEEQGCGLETEQKDPQDEDQVSHRSSSSRLSKSPLKGAKKVKMMQCKVTLLDNTDYTIDVEKGARGQMLFDKVCEHLNLLEKDYFGITYRDVENQKNWLDPSKELKKQIRTGPWNFAFSVKFYPPDPVQLAEDITRYYLCLQLRDDVVSGRLPCSFATHTVLGSYTVQSELGDYDPEEMGSDYLSELRLAPNQTKELEEKVMELHKSYNCAVRGMTPAEAEMHFLENAKKLSMYGVDLHHAKDSEGVEIMLGVCASGLLIYRDRLRINRFAWPKILKISYKRNNFYIKIRPGEFEQFESTIGFKLPNHRAAKRLWKVCVEHHTFFRLVSPEAPPKKFLSLGSKFRYSGRTQAQTRRASSQIIRPAPFFERSSSKRYNMSRSLDGAVVEQPASSDASHCDSSADGVARVKGNIITTVTPERKAEEENGEQVDSQTDVADNPDPAASTPLKQETKTSSQLIPELTNEDRTATNGVYRTMKNQHPPRVYTDDPLRSELSLPSSPVSFTKPKGASLTASITQGYLDHDSSEEEEKIEKKKKKPTSFSSNATRDNKYRETVDNLKIIKTFCRELVLVCLEKQTDSEQTDFAIDGEMTATESTKFSCLLPLLRCQSEADEESEIQTQETGDGAQGPTEWEKRLSSSPMCSPRFDEAPMIEPLELQDEDVSERSVVKVSPGAVTQEVSQAINDKKIIGSDSPKKAMVSWISEEVETVTTKETHDKPEEKPAVAMETEAAVAKPAEPVVDTNGDFDPGVLLSAQTITSETTSTTTTTHITKTVKGGISETRIEKRIVISGDADIDHDQALAQAIKEAKEQHPDMSVTKVVVHKETEITPEEGKRPPDAS